MMLAKTMSVITPGGLQRDLQALNDEYSPVRHHPWRDCNCGGALVTGVGVSCPSSPLEGLQLDLAQQVKQHGWVLTGGADRDVADLAVKVDASRKVINALGE